MHEKNVKRQAIIYVMQYNKRKRCIKILYNISIIAIRYSSHVRERISIKTARPKIFNYIHSNADNHAGSNACYVTRIIINNKIFNKTIDDDNAVYDRVFINKARFYK